MRFIGSLWTSFLKLLSLHTRTSMSMKFALTHLFDFFYNTPLSNYFHGSLDLFYVRNFLMNDLLLLHSLAFRTCCFRRLFSLSIGYLLKVLHWCILIELEHEVRFELTNNCFAGRSLKPLGYPRIIGSFFYS